jgi:hypothetical protein
MKGEDLNLQKLMEIESSHTIGGVGFRCTSSPTNPVYVRRVDSSDLVFSLSSHRHSEIGVLFRFRFIDS